MQQLVCACGPGRRLITWRVPCGQLACGGVGSCRGDCLGLVVVLL